MFLWACSWGGAHVLIDNEWKLMNKPIVGQCDNQEPYKSMKKLDDFYLFNVVDDYVSGQADWLP